MSIRKDVVDKFTCDIDLREQRSKFTTNQRYRESYLRNKKRGDYSIIVDEWDKWEEAIEDDLRNKKIKLEEIIMSESRVLIRLSKAFNNVEVEVSGINSIEEFNDKKEWAYQESVTLIDKLPNEKIDDYIRKPSNQKKYTPKEYVAKKEYTKEPTSGVYTKEHITTSFLKGKQVDIALKGINEGKYTLAQVNGLQSWADQQALLFPPRKY